MYKNKPKINPISSPRMIDIVKQSKDNGGNVYIMNDTEQKAFKMDIIFDAGIKYQSNNVNATAAMNMLNEGSKNHTGDEIAEIFDYYGASIDFSVGVHTSSISLIGLSKYAKEILEITSEIINDSIMPEKELITFLKNKKQNFLIKSQKTNIMARREFLKQMFGEEHPYANNISLEDFDNVKLDDVQQFYNSYIRNASQDIVLAGGIDNSIVDYVNAKFNTKSGRKFEDIKFDIKRAKPNTYRLEKKDAQQSSIIIGKEGVGILDKDYAAFTILNTIVGGYFGSRLMKNIREEKGYTYGIGSANINFTDTAMWMIAADVNVKHRDDSIEECIKEINLLRNNIVGEIELSTVKRYIVGEVLREIDGIFAQSDSFISKLRHNLDNSFYPKFIEDLNKVNAKDIIEIANKILIPEDFIIVTVA